MPQKIAIFCGLEDVAKFTDHCFRRSSATMLADAGGDILRIKQHGGWKSDEVAMGYIVNSVENKNKTARHILGDITNRDVRNDEGQNIHLNVNVPQVVDIANAAGSAGSGKENIQPLQYDDVVDNGERNDGGQCSRQISESIFVDINVPQVNDMGTASVTAGYVEVAPLQFDSILSNGDIVISTDSPQQFLQMESGGHRDCTAG